MSNTAVIALPTLCGPTLHDPIAIPMEEREISIWHRLPSKMFPTLDCPQPSHGCVRMLSSHHKTAFKGQIFPRAACSASASTFSRGLNLPWGPESWGFG